MKFTAATVSAAILLAASSSIDSSLHASAFAIHPSSSVVSQRSNAAFVSSSLNNSNKSIFSSSRVSATTTSSLSMSAGQPLSVGIVGATGAVGKEIRSCLAKRQADGNFEMSKLRIFGSERSAGKVLDGITVELFDVAKARECDVVFLAVSGDFSKAHAMAITEGDDGAVCIDNSSAFRYEKNIPLVVPEINGQETKKSKLIANPNCTTAILLMALWPLHKLFGLKRVIVSTYQAASGAGQPGMDELTEGTLAWLQGKEVTNNIFAHPLPFNVIPQIDVFLENGYTKEEMKVTWETRKICGLPDDFPLSCTAVRIPTIRAHSESVVIETEKPVDVAAARQAIMDAPGVVLADNPDAKEYPMPSKATGQYDIQAGRIRKNLVFGDYGLEFFVCGDQLLRGAALNAVLVAEEMVKNGSLKAKAAV